MGVFCALYIDQCVKMRVSLRDSSRMTRYDWKKTFRTVGAGVRGEVGLRWVIIQRLH